MDTEDETYTSPDQYLSVLEVKDIQHILGVGQRQTYELLNSISHCASWSDDKAINDRFSSMVEWQSSELMLAFIFLAPKWQQFIFLIKTYSVAS